MASSRDSGPWQHLERSNRNAQFPVDDVALANEQKRAGATALRLFELNSDPELALEHLLVKKGLLSDDEIYWLSDHLPETAGANSKVYAALRTSDEASLIHAALCFLRMANPDTSEPSGQNDRRAREWWLANRDKAGRQP